MDREHLMSIIEKEREKLNSLLAGGAEAEETYRQSLVVDKLIEQYMNCI